MSAVVALIRDVRVLATKQNDPKLCVDLVLPERGGTTDKLVMYDVAVPRHRRRYNTSMRRLLGLCRAAGVDLKELLPLEISSSDDLSGLVEALRGKSVEVDVSGRRVRYVGAPVRPVARASSRPTKCDEPPPKDVPLIYHTSGPQEGEIKPCVANALAIFGTDESWRGVLAFDDFEGCCVSLKKPPWYAIDAPAEERWKPGPLTDNDTTRARAWFARKHQMVLNATEAHDAISTAAERHVAHPVRDYLLSTKGGARRSIDTWLIDFCGAEDTPFVRAVSAAWMISAVARVMRPGCKADHMLVLLGPQGVGKSSALAALVPNEDWFNDEFDPDTKDGKIALQGVWIIEVAELAGFRRSEIESIKAALSRRVDKFRFPYGRRDGRYPRQCVLAGSTNAEEFLQDSTGNRRFWPVRVGKVDVERLRAARDALWAEAVARFERGDAWHLKDQVLIDAATEQQEKRLVSDPREEIVAQWLAGNQVKGFGADAIATPRRERGVTTKEVLLGALAMQPDRADRRAEMEAATLLRKCGWRKCSQRHSRGEARVWLYVSPDGCPFCSGLRSEAPAPERDKGKKDRQVGQVGQDSEITKGSAVQPTPVQVGQVGRSAKGAHGANGAAKAAHAAPSHSPVSANVATSPRLARRRGRQKITALGHASTNGAGARSR